MTGIISIPLVPLRSESHDTSEMITQLLFGECVDVLDVKDKWMYVSNCADGYKGWADRKMIHVLSTSQRDEIAGASSFCVPTPYIVVQKLSGGNLLLPGGSMLYQLKDGIFSFAGENYATETLLYPVEHEKSGEQVCELALQYLNAPFLWGGKSILGIDCSGLVQVVFSMIDIVLPRDAEQQIEHGTVIDFLSEVQPGDLAFFEDNDGAIVHVGIMLNHRQVLHAAGCVKIENMDYQGIISSRTGEYTHKLRLVKRLF